MKSIRRLVSLLLTLAMVLGIVGVRAEAVCAMVYGEGIDVGDPIVEIANGVIKVTVVLTGPKDSFAVTDFHVYTDTDGTAETWIGTATINDEAERREITCVAWIPWVPMRNPFWYWIGFSTDGWGVAEGPISICDHEAVGEPVYVRTEYYPYSSDDAHGMIFHKAVDVYRATCSKCGALFDEERNIRDERHTKPVCVCGYVEASYRVVISARLDPMGRCCVGERFRLQIVTKDIVDYIVVGNNVGVEMEPIWLTSDNGNGTKTWETTYKADVPSKGRYWTVKAYRNGTNGYLGSGVTNTLEIPSVAENEEQISRCREALADYLDLTMATRHTTLQWLQNIGVEHGSLRMWQFVASQANDKLRDIGFTIGVSFLETFSDPWHAVIDALNHGGDTYYTGERLEEMEDEVWRREIMNMVLEQAETAETMQATTEVVDYVDYAWSLLDLDLNELDSHLPHTGTTSVTDEYMKMMDDIADGLDELLGNHKNEKWNSIIGDFRGASTTADMFSKFADAVPAILGELKALVNSAEVVASIAKLEDDYAALAADYQRTTRDLLAIIDDAQTMGNAEMESAAREILKNVLIEQKKNESEYVKRFADCLSFIKKAIAAGQELTSGTIETALGYVTGKSLPGLGAVELIAQTLETLLNHNEVYDTAARLFILNEVALSMNLTTRDPENCTFYYKTFDLWARIHAAGCDAAIEFVEAHGGMGVSIEDLRIQTDGQRQQLINLLNNEKKMLMHYAEGLK